MCMKELSSLLDTIQSTLLPSEGILALTKYTVAQLKDHISQMPLAAKPGHVIKFY
jgi:hypothetical protein